MKKLEELEKENAELRSLLVMYKQYALELDRLLQGADIVKPEDVEKLRKELENGSRNEG